MILKPYQTDAVKELIEASQKSLEKRRAGAKIVFKAPTGSGKTIIMAEFLKQLAAEIKDPPLSFIWTAPHKLHYQSKDKLEKYYAGSAALNCANFQDLNNYMIEESQMLFLNWESITKGQKGIITRPNERDFYLRKIIDYTKEAGHKIILVIDESHFHATGKISQELIHNIKPDLVFDVSATPILLDNRVSQIEKLVQVDLDDVRDQCMIKKSIYFNEGFKNVLESGDLQSDLIMADGSQGLVLQKALEKRQELKKAYEAEGSNINPLLLIQLPDRGTPQSNDIFDEVEKHLNQFHNISVKNRKLAIYLSEDKQNLENLQQNDNETEVMIFKQAIALGWDCPRAHILVLFRDWKSINFSIQTVGRIMRMPEPENGHYENDILNHAYVFTNIEKISIQEDLADEYTSIHTSERSQYYKAINLTSYYKIRQDDKTRLSSIFVPLFLKQTDNDDMKDKIDLKDKDIELAWIADFETDSVDALKNQEIQSDKTFDTKSNNDLQKAFDQFVRANIKPFSPQERTIGRVKEAIHEFFDKLPDSFNYPTKSYNRNIRVVLNKANQREFINAIRETMDKYIEATQSKKILLNSRPWEVPERINIKGESKQYPAKKSVMQPFFYAGNWKAEMAFMDYLDASNMVEWWFKNGAKGPEYFAVDYVDDKGKAGLFYVDFVVKFKNGDIGLFDPKSGNTIDAAGQKSDGLIAYLQHQNIGRNNKIWGGIVTNPDTENFKQKWKYYIGAGKFLTASDLKKDWKTLDI